MTSIQPRTLLLSARPCACSRSPRVNTRACRAPCARNAARITPGCLGLWNDEQAKAFKRMVDFVHQQTPAKIGIQIGHAGRKGSTGKPWEGSKPLSVAEGGFDLIALAVAGSVGEMDVLTDAIGAIDGVERTTTSIILSTKFER